MTQKGSGEHDSSEPGRGAQSKTRLKLELELFRPAAFALIAVLLAAFWTLVIFGLLQILLKGGSVTGSRTFGATRRRCSTGAVRLQLHRTPSDRAPGGGRLDLLGLFALEAYPPVFTFPSRSLFASRKHSGAGQPR